MNFSWTIEQMNCYPTHNNQTDVVFNVHWRVNATDGVRNATNYGTQDIIYIADSPYTPYANLTQSQVIDWVKEAMGDERVASIEANIDAQIQQQITPTIVNLPPPWSE